MRCQTVGGGRVDDAGCDVDVVDGAIVLGGWWVPPAGDSWDTTSVGWGSRWGGPGRRGEGAPLCVRSRENNDDTIA